jgi:hypothetical protein
MKKYLIFILLLLTALVQAGSITFHKDAQEFVIQNKKNNKVIKYYLLEPGQSLEFQTFNADTLEVYSRCLDKPFQNYSYILEAKGQKVVIQKSARTSSVSETVSGQTISTYNKITLEDIGSQEIRLTNNSKQRLIFKPNLKNSSASKQKIDYISFSPQNYNKTATVQVRDKKYTYYNSEEIEFTVEGPLYLKVISRLIFQNTLVDSYNYRFQVFMDNDLLGEYKEKAYKSDVAILPADKQLIPSSGDVNIIRIPSGKHDLKICDSDSNRDLIFNFYISKNAVKVEKQ